MELLFLIILIALMVFALGSGYPVAFALPGAAVISIGLAAAAGLIFSGDKSAYFYSGGPYEWLSAGVTNLRGVYWEVERDTLIAIPLFIFMGIMLQRSKVAEDLLMTMAQLFGRVPGGLGISVVFVGAILAATTGIVGATVVAMGLISLPAMLRNNYSPSLASGTIAASGTLGQIIPPSIVLIILADQLASAADQAGTIRKNLFFNATGEKLMPSAFDVISTSAGEMFLGALVPGLVLVALYMLYILTYALFNPAKAPSVPYLGNYNFKFWIGVFTSLVPPLSLIFVVLGSIIGGIATVNQAGAIGATGALIMAGYRLYEGKSNKYYPLYLSLISLLLLGYCITNYDMNVKNIMSQRDLFGLVLGMIGSILLLVAVLWSAWRAMSIENNLKLVMMETAKTTSLVFIILLGAAMLTSAFRAFGGEEIVKHFLSTLPGGFWFQFFVVMLVIFILGFFLDFIEIAVVVVPIVAPILLSNPEANVTAVWLGVMIGLNIQTSFLTPPFGFALFYLRGVAPASVRTMAIYKGVIPFICLQLFALVIVSYSPSLVNYLPSRASLLSESAPPPRNPKLQYCLDQYNFNYYAENKAALDYAVEPFNNIKTNKLPQKPAEFIRNGVDGYLNSYALLSLAFDQEIKVGNASVEYRPIKNQVRKIEKEIFRLEDKLKNDRKILLRMENSDEDQQDILNLKALINSADAQIIKLRSEIPEGWAETYAEFMELISLESKLRNDYRKSADNTYRAFEDLDKYISSRDQFLNLEGRLVMVGENLETDKPKNVAKEIKDLAKDFEKLKSGGEVKKSLTKLRKTMRKSKPDLDKARKEFAEAFSAFDKTKMFLIGTASDLEDQLKTFNHLLARTLGSRQQDSLSREQALFIASCNANHRDVSLYF